LPGIAGATVYGFQEDIFPGLHFSVLLFFSRHHSNRPGPGNKRARYNRGLAYYMIKKTESALSDFKEAKCFCPDDKDTLYMIDLIRQRT
jgi:hypothetical protein